MKLKLLIILIVLTQCSLAQKNSYDFIVIEYNENGTVFRESTKHIDTVNNKINVFFIRKNLYIPYAVPESFENKKHKNETVTIWRDKDGEKDFKSNWTNSYTYDSLSRITKYTFSGCMVCSNMPYEYAVRYNELGQIEMLENMINMKGSFQFHYDEFGQIKRLDCFRSNALTKSIIVKKE